MRLSRRPFPSRFASRSFAIREPIPRGSRALEDSKFEKSDGVFNFFRFFFENFFRISAAIRFPRFSESEEREREVPRSTEKYQREKISSRYLSFSDTKARFIVNTMLRTKYQVPSTKCQIPSTKYQMPNTKYQVPSTVPSIRFATARKYF